MLFVNNITSSRPKTDYRGKELLLEVRRYVLKHIIQLNKVLADIK
jgi:hypothetical protein